MTTLDEVQQEIRRQLDRDYGDRDPFILRIICSIGLAEEAGEVAGLTKRVLRGMPGDILRATPEAFVEELGDVFWYLVACCCAQGISFEDMWQYNVKKLKERYGE